MTAVYVATFRLRCLVQGFRCGGRLDVYGWAILRGPAGTIEIGNEIAIISSPWRSSAASVMGSVRLRTFTREARIIIEDGCGLNGTSFTARTKRIHVKRNVMFAPDCMVVDSDFHEPWPPEARKTNPGFERDADVTIGENVWIGARCIILKGVIIGDNTLVAAGSVVTRSLPPNCLAAGNPARVIKFYGESKAQNPLSD